ncbi:hypothetical protein [Microbacterium halotolerans]|uniref:hypothetical protein n=1 Tax=Microbacterium halotolerans TaxID=246613 RepID=UPI0013C36D65|nr:hypothetical protein [Microbacterium halotolerans]
MLTVDELLFDVPWEQAADEVVGFLTVSLRAEPAEQARQGAAPRQRGRPLA